MLIKPCIVVPVFRHVGLFRTCAKRISLLSIPVLVIDDGNTDQDTKELESITTSHGFQLLKLASNQGKGAAVMQGFRLAFEQGFTHAVQVDADGQHRIEDILTFLEAAREKPEALILGYPLFDKSAPKARVWGRKLTNIMITIETLSFKVKDGLFGFRVYPLEKSLKASERFFLTPGMGFDPSIAVQLCWMDIAVVNIPSPVSYAPDGFSNFRMVKDNFTMIAIHIRLLLLAIPSLLFKPNRSLGKKTDWFKQKERGSRFALKTLKLLYGLGGRSLLSILLFPVILYFYLTAPSARKASKDFLKRVELKSGKSISSFRHFFAFGKQIIDSISAWDKTVGVESINWHGEKEIFSLVDSGQGGFVLSAHIGCLEMARALHQAKEGLKVTPMMYLKNAQMFRTFLEELDPGSKQEIVSLESFDIKAAVEISKRLEKGEFISILADRISASSERAIEVDFLGEKCLLPEGPFAMALSASCPVYSFFCYKDSEQDKYAATWKIFELENCKTRTAKRKQMKGLAQEFARRMEDICLRNPDQWFNFYDYWEKSNAVPFEAAHPSPKQQKKLRNRKF